VPCLISEEWARGVCRKPTICSFSPEVDVVVVHSKSPASASSLSLSLSLSVSFSFSGENENAVEVHLSWGVWESDKWLFYEAFGFNSERERERERARENRQSSFQKISDRVRTDGWLNPFCIVRQTSKTETLFFPCSHKTFIHCVSANFPFQGKPSQPERKCIPNPNSKCPAVTQD